MIVIQIWNQNYSDHWSPQVLKYPKGHFRKYAFFVESDEKIDTTFYNVCAVNMKQQTDG